MQHLFLVLFLPLIAQSVPARDPDLSFERITTAEGPSRGTIYSIIQDKQGFLWLGTATGLVRYDGYTFKRYANNPADSNSISGDFIWNVCEDSSGDLWIGTSGRGLNRYIRGEDRFIRYRNIPGDTTSLAGDEVAWTFVDRNNDVWAGSWNRGLNRLNRATNTFTRYTVDHGLPSNNINKIFEDRSNRFWVGTKRGLALFDRTTGKSRVYKPDPKNLRSLPGEYIFAIYEMRDSSVWLGTENGICKFNPSSDDFTRYSMSAIGEPAMVLCEDKAGSLWIGTDGDGLVRMNPQTGGHTTYTPHAEIPGSISANVVLALYRDRTGVLWIGTAATGLSRLDPHGKKFRHLMNASPSVNALCEDSQGTLWIGTQGTLSFMPRGRAVVRSVQSDAGFPDALRRAAVYAICEDRGGDMWFGTFGSGLFRVNQKTGRTRVYHESKLDDGLPGNEVTSLLVDSHGTLWVGKSGWGLSRYDASRDTFQVYVFDSTPGFPSNYVWVIHEDRGGYLWVGTWNTGVVRFDPRTNDTLVFSKWKVRANGKAISGNTVVSIAEGSDGILWFGTWGDGLNRYDPVTDAITHYSTANGLPNDQIYGILVDEKSGELWLTTGYGLARFNPETGQCRTYDESDGVQSLEFRRGAVHRGRSGMFYVGGVNGFNMFRPEEIKSNTNVPPIVLTGVKAFDRAIPATMSSLELSYADNFLSFEFAALDFAEPRKNLYSYKLEGLEQDWVMAGTRRYVSYANISPGVYVFRVRGSNNDGMWNSDGASITFSITPPPWKTWWAFSLYGLVLVGAGVRWRRYEINKIRRKDREEAALREAELRTEIEKQETRMQIARDLHDEVGSSLSSITFFAQAMSESQRSGTNGGNRFLSLIAESSSHAKEAMSDIIWSINPNNDSWDIIKSKLRRYASELFESKGIAHSIEMPPTDLSMNIDPERRRHFWLLFKEIITNIAKHSHCTEVQIRLTVLEGHVSLTVVDNGTGFDSSLPSPGHGLKNIDARAKLLAATVALKASPGTGTRWKITFLA